MIEQQEFSAKRWLILGSCVSRDILNHRLAKELQIELVDYYARSSLASLASSPLSEPLPECLKNIQSPFQLSMVERDLLKLFYENLATADYDLLLIDMIDERFNLWEDSIGRLCTLSREMVKSGFLAHQQGGKKIISGSEQFWSLWEAGWAYFVRKLTAMNALQRVRVNKVFWSMRTQSGNDFSDSYTQQQVASANALLERMYQRIALDIPANQFLIFDASCLVAADSHQWGISPFHYVDDYYQSALGQILQVSTNQNKSIYAVSHDDQYNETATDAYDIPAWNMQVQQYPSIASALVEGINVDGIHRIAITRGKTLDLCAQGLPLLAAKAQDKVLLVGLSGAVTNRTGRKAPFFSGLGIARSLRLPLIAVADPTLAMDADLPLAWYAGNEELPDFPQQLARVLDGIANQHQARLLIFGGSCGGYAGLLMATLLECRATVMVWNPQTAICDYVPRFVVQYIEAAFPSLGKVVLSTTTADQAKQLRLLLDSTALIHDVRNRKLQQNIDILYLQNQSDWHVAKQAAPYLSKGSWQRVGQAGFAEQQDQQIGVFFGQWGDGHAAPSKAIIEAILRKLASGESITKVIQALDVGLPELCEAPARFDWPAPNSDWHLEAKAWVENARVHATCSTSQQSVVTESMAYAFYLLVDGVRQVKRWYEPNAEVCFDLPELTGKLEVIAFARDRYQKQVNVRVPVEQNTSVAMLIHKSKFNKPIASNMVTDLEVSRFAKDLLENVKNLSVVRRDWRPLSSNPEIESIFSGELVLRTGLILNMESNFSIDWRQNFQDKVAANVLWLNSLEYVGTLLSGFEETKQERYLTAALAIVESFLDFFEASEENGLFLLTRRPGLSSHDHTMAIRTNVFVKLLHILAESSKHPILARRIAYCLHPHALFLIDDGNYTHTNHGVMVDLALAQLGAALGISSAQGKQCADKATDRLTIAIQRAFDRDGLADENTVGYHRFNMGLYIDAVNWFVKWRMGEQFATIARPILESASTALRYAVWPDGSIPPLGDSPVYPKAALSINQSRLFSESHFGVIKNDNLYVSLVCGWRGQGHKHADDTSLTIRYMDTDIIIDAGSYKYDQKDPLRQCLESSFGHSGIFLTATDGFLRIPYLGLKPAAMIKDWEEDSLGVKAIAEIRFDQWGATLQRRVEVLWPNRVLVSDRVSIDKGFSPMTARQSWLLGEEMQLSTPIQDSAGETITIENGSVRATMRFSKHASNSWTETYSGATQPMARGWCSQTFGKISPTTEFSRFQTGMLIEFNVEIELARL